MYLFLGADKPIALIVIQSRNRSKHFVVGWCSYLAASERVLQVSPSARL